MPILKMYVSFDTEKILKEEIKSAINKYNVEYGVEKALIKAIIMKESSDNPFAMRYEKHLKKANWYLKNIPGKYKDSKFAYCSMGCMQILYGIAKSYGFKGTPHELLNPDTSVKYGVRHLKELIKRYYYLDRVISAYNQGTPATVVKTGKFKNQSYVDGVLTFYKGLHGRVKF